MKKIKVIFSILIGSILFSGCATVNRGNFKHMQLDPLSSYKNSYNVIDTKKEKIDIPNPPVSVIERFEVVDGGCAGQDCGSSVGNNGHYGDRERIELKVPPHNRDTFNGSEFWYTWSIYFPKDYKSIYPAASMMGQFYEKGYGPKYAFEEEDGYYLDVDHGSKILLIDNKNLRAKWHTIKIHAKWSKSNDGIFKVWVDNKVLSDFKGQTMFDSATEVYMKYGIYRNFISRYKNPKVMEIVKKYDNLPYREAFLKAKKEVKLPTQIVYYSNVRRANTEKGLIPSNK